MPEVREFIVHREPKGKQRVRVTRSGHAYTPNDTTTYEGIVRSEYWTKYQNKKPLQGSVTVRIVAFYEIPKSWSKKKHDEAVRQVHAPTKKPDCDNIAKMICDALNGLAYKDDAQITDLRVLKLYSDELPFVAVTLIGETEE